MPAFTAYVISMAMLAFIAGLAGVLVYLAEREG